MILSVFYKFAIMWTVDFKISIKGIMHILKIT